jgi:hypothetical protein
VNGHPADRSDNREDCSDGKGCNPAEALRDPWCQRCRDRAADLSPHIHHTGEDAGAAAGDIDGYGPERTLREIEGAGTTGEYDTGSLGAVNLGPKHEKCGGHQHGHGGQTAAADAKSVGPGEPVAESSSGETADRHRKKWEHRVAGAGFEIEATHLGHVEKEPTEEYPRDIAEAEITLK